MNGTRNAVILAIGLAMPSGARGATSGESPPYRIAYATYLGGRAWDQLREVIVRGDGSVLVAGQSASADAPTTAGAVQPKYAGDDPALGHGGIFGGDCYIARLSPDGSNLITATFFGGSKQERNVYGIGLDRAGNIVITSCTRSADCPTTPGAFQRQYGGATDWLVAKLSGDLTRLLWCTYIGGSGDDSPRGGLALDAEDHVYVVGATASADFPTTPGAFQRQRRGRNDGAIVKLKPDGSALAFATLLGGSGADGTVLGARVTAAGELVVGGHTESADFPVTPDAAQPRIGGQSDAYIARLARDGSQLKYATFLGGAGQEFAEYRLHLSGDGSVILTGSAGSADFPATAGALQRTLKGRSDGFVSRLAPDGRAFPFSTLLGGSGADFLLMPTPDAAGNIFVVGQTSSPDLPITSDALQKTYGGGASDGFLAVLSPDGARLVYATYLGGSGEDMIRSVALGPEGEVYLVGNSASKDFPVTDAAFQRRLAGHHDGFAVKLVPASQ